MNSEQLYNKDGFREFDIYSLTLLNDTIIVNKIKNELNKIENSHDFSTVFDEIADLNEIARSKGYLHLSTYIEKTESYFLKEILTLVTFCMKQSNTEIIHVSNSVYPYFLFDSLTGAEFIEAVLIYEAILLIVVGTPQSLIEYRLNGIVNRKMPFLQLVEKYK